MRFRAFLYSAQGQQKEEPFDVIHTHHKHFLLQEANYGFSLQRTQKDLFSKVVFILMVRAQALFSLCTLLLYSYAVNAKHLALLLSLKNVP